MAKGRRIWWIGALAVLVAAAGAAAYMAGHFPRSPDPGTRGGQDPTFRAVSVAALARPGTQHPLTKEQIDRIVPLLRALKGIAPDDQAVVQAVADEIINSLAPAQRAELAQRREETLARRRAQSHAGGPGSGGPPGVGAGAPRQAGRDPGAGSAPPGSASAAARRQFRTALIDRAIRALERVAEEEPGFP